MSEFSEEAKNLAPHSNGYLYWINGGCHVTWTHPNDWKFENPDGINYIKTFAGMKKPGVLFEGWDILRAIENADSLDQLYECSECGNRAASPEKPEFECWEHSSDFTNKKNGEVKTE